MQPTDEQLLWREGELRAEANAVWADLKLADRLRHMGDPVWVGSAALGLMAWRDLDVTVVCAELDDSHVVALGGLLALASHVRQLTYRDDSQLWNEDPRRYPDGLYLGVRYCRVPDQEWNLDIWFVDEPARQPDLAHLRSMPPRLDQQTRPAILRIKDRWAGNPQYGRSVKSFDIYTAVLDHGVRTPEQFDEWLIRRGTDSR